MDSTIDLDAYLQRIGYTGPRAPNLDTLRSLHALHPDAIVFEALDVLLGRGVSLDPVAVDAKLIGAGRGGYCFEQNSLFRRALLALGFEVEGLAGRVRWMLPPDAPPTPQTHMALRVTLDGEQWLADVGFGGCVLTEPLRLGATAPQHTRHGAFRLIPSGHRLMLQARLGEAWADTYEISTGPVPDIDYELGNWFTSTHPDSRFRNNLIVARTTAEARYTLLNNRYTVRHVNGDVQRQVLDAAGIDSTLTGTFRLPVESSWRPVIKKCASFGATVIQADQREEMS